jgi:hypothetical protein
MSNPLKRLPVLAAIAIGIAQVGLVPPTASAATSLYPFTSFTFTSGGLAENFGPTLTRLLTTYDTSTYTWLKNSSYFNMVTQGIQIWTVPQTGNYQITARGAQGVPATSTAGGLGAVMVGTFALTQGDKYRILVGETTTYGTSSGSRLGLSSSGGGGSFVVKLGVDTISGILVIAGGGGGTGANSRNTNANAIPDSTTAPSSSDGFTGGSNGNKGNTGNADSGAGGGFLTGGNSVEATGGAFISGGQGGRQNAAYANNGGGFGGGGSSANGSLARFGGGGGFNGGGATNSISTTDPNNLNYGGGGSSYNMGAFPSNTVGNYGAGSVTIELVIPKSSISISSPSTGTYGITLTITANASMDGKVTFYARGKRIPNCISIPTISTVATCLYKVATRNSVDITATLVPTDSNYANSIAAVKNLRISNRATNR